MNRRYSELILLPTFEERFEYLRLDGRVGESTFGYDRYVNQMLYHSDFWDEIRNGIIIRDDGMDLAMPGYPIIEHLVVHHINPITLEDIEEMRPIVSDPENLICVSLNTHSAIHYGNKNLLPKLPIERRPWDTCPWRT